MDDWINMGWKALFWEKGLLKQKSFGCGKTGLIIGLGEKFQKEHFDLKFHLDK